MNKIESMRDALMNHTRYSGSASWQARVSKMPTNQIIAVYKKFESKGEFDRRTRNGRELRGREILEERNGHQITMFEYLSGLKEGV